jgi:hypothetical protein
MLKEDCAKKGVIPIGYSVEYENVQYI